MRWRADDKVILLPCGSWDAKRWPEINWIKLITRLKSTGLKVTVVIGPAERGYYTDLQSSGIEVCLPDSLKELVEVLSSESIIIGNDCGPLHLANALGKSCVAIFGPTNPYRWFWYHNERQRFLQTEYSYRRITTPDQRIERGETWDSWPDVEEVFGLTLDILRSSLSTKINPTS
jgi:ADP-heptose:LPS heptosyltransferase